VNDVPASCSVDADSPLETGAVYHGSPKEVSEEESPRKTRRS
jgi:hypothetical protein